MRTLLTIITFAISAQFVDAAESTDISAKIKSEILKRYPQAQDFQFQNEIHFGNKLLEVSYKPEPAVDDRNLELYTQTGRVFTNEVVMEGYDQMPSAVFNALKSQFGDFKIDRAEMVGNPNGAGEEYELYLTSQSVRWRVSISDKGQVFDKKSL